MHMLNLNNGNYVMRCKIKSVITSALLLAVAHSITVQNASWWMLITKRTSSLELLLTFSVFVHYRYFPTDRVPHRRIVTVCCFAP